MKIKLYVTKFVSKSGRTMAVLKFGDKIVSFDESLISYMCGVSTRALLDLQEDIVLAEF